LGLCDSICTCWINDLTNRIKRYFLSYSNA
jgi:hypothetical protein